MYNYSLDISRVGIHTKLTRGVKMIVTYISYVCGCVCMWVCVNGEEGDGDGDE